MIYCSTGARSVLSAVILLGALCELGQAQQIPRTASGKPNLQGIWQARGRAAYDLQFHAAKLGMPGGQGVLLNGRRFTA
jgi:hypothetical protein